MKEEIIISGRQTILIDPTLNVWHWEIPLYLFLGGLAAGLLFFAALFTILNKEKEYPTATRIAPMLAPIALTLGLIALFLDLHHKLYFWRLYINFRIEAPMSWGAWTLLIITPLSILWSAINIKSIFPNWDWKLNFLKSFFVWIETKRLIIAWTLLILSLILGVYTGILLSAFNARPLWNTSVLGPLFLCSGLSAGAAFIVMISKSKLERHKFAQIDLILIGIELFLIIHLFMGFMASNEAQIQAAQLFLGGEYTASFWIFVVLMGLILPACLEFLDLKGKRIPIIIPGILILFGSLMLRFIISYAGQLSSWN